MYKKPPIVWMLMILCILCIAISTYFGMESFSSARHSDKAGYAWMLTVFLVVINLLGILRKKKYSIYLSTALVILVGIGLFLGALLAILIGHGDVDEAALAMFLCSLASFFTGWCIHTSRGLRRYTSVNKNS